MLGRLWYPQLDVYDTIRRMGLLLLEWGEKAPSSERLFIADFFLANPPLLHKTNMETKVRDSFRVLKIPKQDKTFLQYPLAPILYHKMESVQKKALQAFIGKGMIDLEGMKIGQVKLSAIGNDIISDKSNISTANHETRLITFLVNEFAIQKDEGIRERRQRTGLRRAV